jgi:hypothetical protein
MDGFPSRRVCVPPFVFPCGSVRPCVGPFYFSFIDAVLSETGSRICRRMEAAGLVPMALRLLHRWSLVTLVRLGNRPGSTSTRLGRKNCVSSHNTSHSPLLFFIFLHGADTIVPSLLLSQLSSCRKVVPTCSTLERRYGVLTGVLSIQTTDRVRRTLHLVPGPPFDVSCRARLLI